MSCSYQQWLINVCECLETLEKRFSQISWGAINCPDFIKGRNDDRYYHCRQFIIELAKAEKALEIATDNFFEVAKENDVLAIRHKLRR